MNTARDSPVTYVYDGKIYVIGGIRRLSEYESWGEVFNIKTQTWEYLPKPSFANEETISDYYYYDPKQCKWEKKSDVSQWRECVMDNVSYSIQNHGDRNHGDRFNLSWRDMNGSESKEVKGLDSFVKRYNMPFGSIDKSPKVASCGGKLYIMWQVCLTTHHTNNIKKIWCAEISIEKRDGDEIQGNVEWLDVVHTTSKLCFLLNFLAISV